MVGFKKFLEFQLYVLGVKGLLRLIKLYFSTVGKILVPGILWWSYFKKDCKLWFLGGREIYTSLAAKH